jgi:hypothetical protein
VVSQTVLDRPHKAAPVIRTISRPTPAARKPLAPPVVVRRLEPCTFPAKLQEVEERLLSEAMERHPGRERAVTHLLNDLEKPAGMSRSAARLTQPSDAAHIERIEDLLLEAIMRTHPNHGSALDRLLGDVVGDAAIDDADAEHAEAEMEFDNDFDGLG